MLPGKLMAVLGTLLLFGVGFAAAALADPPPSTTDSTTTTSATTSTTSTETPTTTSTVTTTTTTAVTTTAQTTSTSTTAAPPSTPTPVRVPPGATSVRDRLSASARPAHAQRKKRRRRISRPLAVTPPLGRASYVFPVVGPAGYGDSYGAFRGDVHGKWHHGDDIFAPLGAPVVAVADGTVNRVGWHRIGGWRLWVRNASADQFYYAHLSGYVRSIFHSRHVRAGQVIGFVGNTGDAYTGVPHLHFEVHPHQLLHLRYDGAVDPTTYLDSWRRVQSVDAPAPMHPRLPRQRHFRSEASVVFRRLLAARHSTDPSPTAIGAEIDRPEAGGASQPHGVAARELRPVATAAAGDTLAIPLLVGFLSLAFLVGMPVLGTMALGRLFRKRVEGD